MKLTKNHAEGLSLLFYVTIVALIFQQISTDLTQQGIADGDPFHNAAFYPRAVAILIIGIVCVRVVQLGLEITRNTAEAVSIRFGELVLPGQILVIFALYLYLLEVLGYHLVTAPFLALVTYICGDRKYVSNSLFSISVALLIAFIFEKYLRLVLPGGMFSFNISW